VHTGAMQARSGYTCVVCEGGRSMCSGQCTSAQMLCQSGHSTMTRIQVLVTASSGCLGLAAGLGTSVDYLGEVSTK
jgi:hypothetical protein